MVRIQNPVLVVGNHFIHTVDGDSELPTSPENNCGSSRNELFPPGLVVWYMLKREIAALLSKSMIRISVKILKLLRRMDRGGLAARQVYRMFSPYLTSPEIINGRLATRHWRFGRFPLNLAKEQDDY